MSLPALFKDLNKSVKAVLSDGHLGQKTSVEVSTKTANGTVLKANTAKEGAADLTGDLAYEVKCPNLPHLVKVKLETSNKLAVSTVLKNLKPGLEVSVGSTLSLVPSASQSVDATAQYKHAKGNVVASVKYAPVKKTETVGEGEAKEEKLVTVHNTSVTLSGVVAQAGFAVGGEVKVDALKQVADDYTVATQYSTSDYTITASVEKKLTVGKLNFRHNLSKDLALAAEYTHNVQLPKKAAEAKEGEAVAAPVAPKPGVLTVGFLAQLPSSGSLRAKVNTQGVLGVSYTEKVRENTTVTLSSEVNAFTLAGHKVGLGITYEN